MTTIEASAPGKIVLSGEYAVLFGAPAIAVAIDRRARVCVHRRSDEISAVRTKGFGNIQTEIKIGPGGIVEWLGGGRLALLEHACQVTAGPPWPACEFTLDTTEFFDPESDAKYGLGSSAALSTALVLALSELREEPELALPRATAAHLALQQGAGSGVDIAASFHGGLIEFRMYADNSYRPLDWPGGLHWLPIWSGRAASTQDQLRKLADIDDVENSIGNLLAASGSAALAWQSGHAQQVLNEMREYTNALRGFNDDHDLGIFSGGHDHLWEMAERNAILYKPCGAGGGDVGVAFGTDANTLNAFGRSVDKAGYRVLQVSSDQCGATIDYGQDSD